MSLLLLLLLENMETHRSGPEDANQGTMVRHKLSLQDCLFAAPLRVTFFHKLDSSYTFFVTCYTIMSKVSRKSENERPLTHFPRRPSLKNKASKAEQGLYARLLRSHSPFPHGDRRRRRSLRMPFTSPTHLHGHVHYAREAFTSGIGRLLLRPSFQPSFQASSFK